MVNDDHNDHWYHNDCDHHHHHWSNHHYWPSYNIQTDNAAISSITLMHQDHHIILKISFLFHPTPTIVLFGVFVICVWRICDLWICVFCVSYLWLSVEPCSWQRGRASLPWWRSWTPPPPPFSPLAIQYTPPFPPPPSWPRIGSKATFLLLCKWGGQSWQCQHFETFWRDFRDCEFLNPSLTV